MSVAAIAASLAVQLPNSRASESEADEIGIELAAKAGYNPNAAITLWQKMGQVSGESGPQFMSTHPNPGKPSANTRRARTADDAILSARR